MNTEQTIEKKDWEKPKLIVLVRGEPEEDVLGGGCKNVSQSGISRLPCDTLQPCFQSSVS